ncbi:MAG: TatD family hydrolase [Microthrixaceae bacterium]
MDITVEVQWIDNHCHLEDDSALSGVLAECSLAGVSQLITVGTDAASSAAGLDLASRHEQLWATAGLHPHEADQGLQDVLQVINDNLGNPKLVAIGECGLDYHYDHSPREVQRRVFAQQIALAHEHHLPLVIHTRNAWDETFEILDAESIPVKTVFHCFTGGPAEAAACLDRGALLSISGIVTFPSAADVREAVRVAPLNSLMVETDSPFLTPVPHRGRPNSPALVGLIGAEIAEQHQIPVAVVAAQTTETARELYGLGPS